MPASAALEFDLCKHIYYSRDGRDRRQVCLVELYILGLWERERRNILDLLWVKWLITQGKELGMLEQLELAEQQKLKNRKVMEEEVCQTREKNGHCISISAGLCNSPK